MKLDKDKTAPGFGRLAGLALVIFTLLASPLAAQTPTPTPKPNTANTPVMRNDWMSAHEKYVQTAKLGNIDVFFIGDSITAGWTNSKSGGPVWKENFVPLKAASFGIGGDQTENVLWRIQNGLFEGTKPRVVVLMIGTNNLNKNSPPQIAEAITTIVRDVERLSPDTRILLLGIFPRGAESTNSERKKIIEVNQTISKLDDGKRVFYRDIGSAFLEPDGTLSAEIAPDALHLSTKGYQRWADAIRDDVTRLHQSE